MGQEYKIGNKNMNQATKKKKSLAYLVLYLFQLIHYIIFPWKIQRQFSLPKVILTFGTYLDMIFSCFVFFCF